jgi:hypothetical protein
MLIAHSCWAPVYGDGVTPLPSDYLLILQFIWVIFVWIIPILHMRKLICKIKDANLNKSESWEIIELGYNFLFFLSLPSS